MLGMVIFYERTDQGPILSSLSLSLCLSDGRLGELSYAPDSFAEILNPYYSPGSRQGKEPSSASVEGEQGTCGRLECRS